MKVKVPAILPQLAAEITDLLKLYLLTLKVILQRQKTGFLKGKM